MQGAEGAGPRALAKHSANFSLFSPAAKFCEILSQGTRFRVWLEWKHWLLPAPPSPVLLCEAFGCLVRI